MRKINLPVALLASLLLAFVLFSCKKDGKTVITPEPETIYPPTSIYHYTFKSIDDESEVKISSFKGKKIMFVNTASYCGNTPQYAKLQSLYETYKDKLVIIGFPCNQFNGQEPGSDSTIKDFCTFHYGVTFPLSSKIDVMGSNRDSVYIWLTEKSFNGVETTTVAWNFQKYLIDVDGKYLQMFPNNMQPDDPKIIEAINK